jgi:hypothetical protein
MIIFGTEVDDEAALWSAAAGALASKLRNSLAGFQSEKPGPRTRSAAFSIPTFTKAANSSLLRGPRQAPFASTNHPFFASMVRFRSALEVFYVKLSALQSATSGGCCCAGRPIKLATVLEVEPAELLRVSVPKDDLGRDKLSR